jgi:hypothetical protein
MMPIKPVHPGDAPLAPGPTATPAEHRWFAEDNAYHSLLKQRWEGWVAAHPDDAEITHAHSFIAPIGALKAADPATAPKGLFGGPAAPPKKFVIEGANSTKAKPMYFANDAVDDAWTDKLADAQRFASKADAEALAKSHGFQSPRFTEVAD